MKRILAFTILVIGLSITFPLSTVAQFRVDEVEGKSSPQLNRSRGIGMLKQIKKVLETYYYDKNYRGIDIDKKFDEATVKIKQLDTNSQIFRVIAGLLLEFNDSHTRFIPPNRSNRVEYGFSMQMVGIHCFVVDVKKGSDAEKKGVKMGDRVLKVGQYDITRDNLWVLNYFIYQLEPMEALPVTLLRQDGKQVELTVAATYKTLKDRKKEADERRKKVAEKPFICAKLSQTVTACKLKSFSVEKKFIDQMMTEAAGSSKLILDLRSNGGGLLSIQEYLSGHFIDREIKIADMITRTKTRTLISKPVKNRFFSGELAVLIDSRSASASELFSRMIQIEKRGKVIGDISAGAVMASYNIPMQLDRGPQGYQTITPFGFSITIADLIMGDGERLEHVGVYPDHPVGPTAKAISDRNDPILAYAAELFGIKISSEDAGKLGFLYTKTEADDDDDNKDNDL